MGRMNNSWCHQADRPITQGDVGKLIVISGHGLSVGTVKSDAYGLKIEIEEPLSARRRSIAARAVTHYTLLDSPAAYTQASLASA